MPGVIKTVEIRAADQIMTVSGGGDGGQTARDASQAAVAAQDKKTVGGVMPVSGGGETLPVKKDDLVDAANSKKS